MTTGQSFEPTLAVPIAWIEELTGTSHHDQGPLYLSYRPNLQERLGQLGCTLAEIETDFGNGYRFRKIEGTESPYYIFESTSFKIWAQPRQGWASGNQLTIISKIDRTANEKSITDPPIFPVVLVAIQDELASIAESFHEYRKALHELDAPPPPIERSTAPQEPEEPDRLWRHEAFADLLEALRRRAERMPRLRVEGTVIAIDNPGPADDDPDAVLRVQAKMPLAGWKPDILVQVSLESGPPRVTRTRDVDGSTIDLDSDAIQPPKPGSHVEIEEIYRFSMAAHRRAMNQFLRGEVIGNWHHLCTLLEAPEDLVPGDASETGQGTVPTGPFTDEQHRAIDGAVSTPHAFFIQGPPGTGKTTVITEIVQHLVRRGERVLLLATTNVAVDEVLKRIDKKDGVLPVRLTWSAEKVDPAVREYCLEHAVRALVKKVLRPRQGRDDIWAAREQAARREGASVRRVDALRSIEERWIQSGREPGAEAALVDEIGPALLRAANLICATTVGVASKRFSDVGDVDTLIVDEASRVTDAEFLIGAVRARRWILVGDEHQLPPHVDPDAEHFLHATAACSMVDREIATDLRAAVDMLAEEWQEEEKLHAFRVDSVMKIAEELFREVDGRSDWREHYKALFEGALHLHGDGSAATFRELLRTLRHLMIRSLFERAVKDCSPALRARLTEQRRMIDPIARLVRGPVYDGDYVSPDASALARMGVTPLVCDAFPTPVTFLDTGFRGPDAAEEPVGTGFINRLEAQWIIDACERFDRGLAHAGTGTQFTVSVLCFYGEQARYIRGLLAQRERRHRRLHIGVVDVIDRIQGQESDIVIISFCRTKRGKGRVSARFGMWLRDIRRLNVAFTRARRALVLVGHRPTLAQLGAHQPFYINLFTMFSLHPADSRMIHDFGPRRRRR